MLILIGAVILCRPYATTNVLAPLASDSFDSSMLIFLRRLGTSTPLEDNKIKWLGDLTKHIETRQTSRSMSCRAHSHFTKCPLDCHKAMSGSIDTKYNRLNKLVYWKSTPCQNQTICLSVLMVQTAHFIQSYILKKNCRFQKDSSLCLIKYLSSFCPNQYHKLLCWDLSLAIHC